MKDQLKCLHSIGVSSVSLSDLKNGYEERIEKVALPVVFGNPKFGREKKC